MASLAEINQTLKDQTQVLAKEDTLEDNNARVVDLQARLQQYLEQDANQAGDRREKEIENARRERRAQLSSRPRGFSEGLSRGFFGDGNLLNSLSEKLFGALGIAAGAVGLGAAKLLKGGLAYAALSDFAEKAIASTIQNIDDKYLDFDLTEQQKENITEGAQTAIAARLLGIKSPLGLAAAGVIGAWGDEVIAHINKEYGNEDGTYNVAGMEINTNSEGFVNALGITAALIAPTLLKTVGKGLLFALKKFPAIRLATVLAGGVGAMLGLSSGAADARTKEAAANKGDPRNKPGAYDSGSRPKVTLPDSTNPRILTANIDRAPSAPQFSANMDRPPTTPKSIANAPSVRRQQNVPLKFPQLEGLSNKLKASLANAKTVPKINIDSKAISSKYSTFGKGFDMDKLIKPVAKLAVPAVIAYDAYLGTQSKELENVSAGGAAATNVATGATLGTVDFLNNAVVDAYNVLLAGQNKLAQSSKYLSFLEAEYLSRSNLQQQANQAIAPVAEYVFGSRNVASAVSQQVPAARVSSARTDYGERAVNISPANAMNALDAIAENNMMLRQLNSQQPVVINNIDNSTTDNSSNSNSSIVSTGTNRDTFSLVQ